MTEAYRPPSSGEATPSLDVFRAAYDVDDNEWWRLACGHHQNLFDTACDEIDELRERLRRLTGD